MRAYSRKKSIYTRPRLRQRLKKQILNSDRYGKRGQWNARRSQLLAKEYRAAGRGYRNQRKLMFTPFAQKIVVKGVSCQEPEVITVKLDLLSPVSSHYRYASEVDD